MGEDNNGANMKKADLILMRVDKIYQQTAAVDSKVSSLAKNGAKATDKDDIVKKLSDENETLKQELRYMSAQTESIYTELSKMLNKLSNEVQELKSGSPVATASAAGIDMDELASRVAEKIVIPRAATQDIDGDALANEIAEKINVPVHLEIDYDLLADKVAEKMPQAKVEAIAPANVDINVDELAAKVAERLPSSQGKDIDYDVLGSRIVQNMYIPSAIVEDIDYDTLADKISKAIPAPEVISPDYIASKVAEQIVVPAPVVQQVVAAPEQQTEQPVATQQTISYDNLDMEELSRKIAERITISTPAAPIYDVPEVVIDDDKIAYSISEKLKDKLQEIMDELKKEPEEVVEHVLDDQAITEHVAQSVAEKLSVELNTEMLAKSILDNISLAVDSEEIADCVAKRVGTIAPEQFDVMVDDEGCDSIAQSISQKLNYEYLASAVAEKFNPSYAYASAQGTDIDTEELAKSICDKISVNATVNEDAIADKAAAILSNYMPEIDTDEIADKVVAGVIPAIPAAPVIDYENISSSVSERIVESQEDKDYDIVIDDDGLARISEGVSDEIKREYASRFDGIDSEIERIKTTLSDGSITENVEREIQELKEALSGGTVTENVENEIKEINAIITDGSITHNVQEEIESIKTTLSDGSITENVEREIQELKALILSGVIVRTTTNDETAATQTEEVAENQEEETEEQLVTVSDIVTDEQAEDESESEEDEEDDDEVIDEIVDDIDENLSEGEIMPDGILGISNGVDFSSMMKYNRSFIARIIQGSDEVKQYYGEVKNALLSYKKVNSNIAWGAERFNKGRETIARFKIRGKTLCLYLALDPNEYKTSVYHHLDVTENKSMHGTPMMVKIKSPLGARKAIRLIDEMLAKRDGIKQITQPRDYAAMYPYESIDELIEDGLVKDVSKK